MKEGTIKATAAARYLETEGDVFATVEGASVEEVLGRLTEELEGAWKPAKGEVEGEVEVELVLRWSGTKQAPLCGGCGLRGRPVQGHCPPFCGARRGAEEKAVTGV